MACVEFHRTQAELDHWHATGAALEPFPTKTEAHRLRQAEDDRFYCANLAAFEAVDEMPAKLHAGVIAKLKVFASMFMDK